MSNAQNRTKVIFDLDGVIFDVSERYFQLHQAAQKFALKTYEQRTYWSLKTQGLSEEQILSKINSHSLKDYLNFRSAHIEEITYLKFDKLIVQKELLLKLAPRYDFYIVTLRRKLQNLMWQLMTETVSDCFKGMFARHHLSVKQQNSLDDYEQKSLLLAMCLPAMGDFFIGDTELDYKTGKRYQLKTYLVSSGLCREDYLRGRFNKSAIHTDINCFLNTLS